jgi:hypothetical protein
MYFYEIKTIVWICIALFFVTGVVTIAALLGWVTLGSRDGKKHEYYLRILFASLITEIVGISVATFAAVLSNPARQAPVELGLLEARVQQIDDRVKALTDRAPQGPRWIQIGVGDCSGNDFSRTPGAEPNAGLCGAANITAVCWDGALFQNGGSAWCTYKRIAPDQCTGGTRPGRLFRCEPA